jgi:glutamate racemase
MSTAAEPKRSSAIGVFDSGIGGLTVVRELLKIVPDEKIVYLGDTARVPYGNKSRDTIVQFSTENVLFLLRHDVKMVVIACHTASSFAQSFLASHFNHPILGVIDPGVEMAVRATRNGRIGVIGTNATVGSGAYPSAIQRLDPTVKLFQKACPLFVPLVEEGLLADPLTTQVARRYLKPLQQAKVDTLILGCTHYPLLKKTIGEVMGPKVTLVDSAHQVALKVKQVLGEIELDHARNGSAPAHKFYVTDEPRHFDVLSRRFLGRSVGDVQKV